jgi:quercetin dioxygenase-like cupin family protein
LTQELALTAAEFKFVALPNAPPDVLSAVAVGDVAAQGVYVLRNRFPPNYRLPAHNHAEWRVMTVLEGTVYFSYGDTFDESRLKAYGPGSLIIEPAGKFHYFTTRGEGAVVQFVAQGPLTAEFAPSVRRPGAPPAN